MQTKRRPSLSWALAGLAATFAGLTACGGSGSGPSAPQPPCAPSGAVTLVYPAPNATAIPDNVSGIVFASQAGVAASSQALLLPANTSGYFGFNVIVAAPSPLPSPYLLPSFANPVLQESTNPNYVAPAATGIGVYYNNFAAYCTPVFLGAFTTQ